MRDDLIEFMDDLRDYVAESGTNIAHDERDSSEFVDVFLSQRKSSCASSIMSRLPDLDRFEMEGGMGVNMGKAFPEKDSQGDWVRFEDVKKLLNESQKSLNINYQEVILEQKSHNMACCMLSILDSLKLYDSDSLLLGNETLSELMFRLMSAYDIDLNKELGLTHLKPANKSML